MHCGGLSASWAYALASAVIFNAMRSGFAPFSGAGGGGIITVRMRDGQWSPPSFISPNNFAAGLMIGLDVYQCVLVLRYVLLASSSGRQRTSCTTG